MFCVPLHIRTLNSLIKLSPGLAFFFSGYSAVTIALGSYHTCAIVSGGGVKCWGYNGYGQLGIGGSSDRYSPADVNLGSGIASRVQMLIAFKA